MSPIPNWCSNELRIVGKTLDVVTCVRAISDTDGDNNKLSFETFCPTPKNDDGTDVRDDWYEWRVANWGTKWDVSDAYFVLEPCIDAPGYITASVAYDTAWGPAVELFEKVAAQFPEVEIEMTYDEPGMDFAGGITWSEGERDEFQTNSEVGAQWYTDENDVEHEISDSCCDGKSHFVHTAENGNFYMACNWGHCELRPGHEGECKKERLVDA